MKKGKILLVGIILILVRVPEAFSSFSYWDFKTPNNSFLWGDAYGGEIYNGKTIIEYPERWYFYKNHIIGSCHNEIEKKTSKSYFVLNELNQELYQFTSEKDWKTFLQKNNLTPKIWTRWFEYHSANLFFILWFLMLSFWFISIPLLIFLCWALYKFLKEIWRVEKFSPKKPFTRILILKVLLIYFFYFLNTTVNSF